MAHVDRPPSRAVLAAVVLLLVAAGAPPVAGQTTTTTVVDPDSLADRGAACTGTVGECISGGGMARRELGPGGYISYDAMSRGRVPCSYRGASYYNCRPGASANPYSRGCSAITRCRG